MRRFCTETRDATAGWRAGRKNGGSSGRLSGRTVLFSLIGFFAVVIGVNVTMMTLAISTMPGTEVESPYLAGIKYNAEIASARAQEARGWHLTSHVDRAGDGRAVVTIEARDRNGAPLTGLALAVRLARPTDKRADRAFMRRRDAPPAAISARRSDVAAGIWDLEVEADRGGERLFPLEKPHHSRLAHLLATSGRRHDPKAEVSRRAIFPISSSISTAAIARMEARGRGHPLRRLHARRSRTASRAMPDIVRARVNLTDRRVAVEWRDGKVDPSPASSIDWPRSATGPIPSIPANPAGDERREGRMLLRCLGVAAFATMNVMLLSVSVWSGNVSDISPEQRDFFHWLSALIALPASAYAGRAVLSHSAVRAIKARRLNMDVPITVGVLLALGMSVVETLNHAEHAYFDSALMLLTFLLVGRTLEQFMRRRTRAVAGNMAALRAETATKFVGPHELCEVPVESIRPGDLVLVRPGERIAVDGVVVQGRSQIDQSLVTGETMPVTASEGSMVYAGTMNASSGTLRVRVSTAAQRHAAR